MRVRQLIEALKPYQDATVVALAPPNDPGEFFVHVIVLSRTGRQIYLCENDSEVAIHENVLHRDLTEADGQFGVGA